MLKQLLLFAAGTGAAIFTLTSNPGTEAAKAEATQVDGFYIFTDSKPLSDYTYIATVTPKTVQVGQAVDGNPQQLQTCELTYTQLRDDFIKQAKKKHKEATGIIINAGEQKGELIKLQ